MKTPLLSVNVIFFNFCNSTVTLTAGSPFAVDIFPLIMPACFCENEQTVNNRAVDKLARDKKNDFISGRLGMDFRPILQLVYL